MQPLLKLTGIKRSYGAVQALRSADFEIYPGEVMGLVGENGAGKSTMVKIISGFDSGFTGEYLLNDEPIHFTSPTQAERAGLAVAQQELSLIPTMSVAENISVIPSLLGWERDRIAARTDELLRLEAAGYRDYRWLQLLPPLHVLYGDQRFQVIIASMRADVERQRALVLTADWLPPELREAEVEATTPLLREG